jgi:allophanate hydrolase subunit 2
LLLPAAFVAEYRVTRESDRMGLRLDGPPIAGSGDAERLSTPVLPGAIQSAGGRPIVLGPACGTMGGYPHVAHVIAADLPYVAQLRAGDRVRFVRVSLDDARRIGRSSRDALDRLVRTVAAVASDVVSTAEADD